MYLLDTDIFSGLRRRDRNPGIVGWVTAQRTADLYLSVVTVGEIERGIIRQRRRNPHFAKRLGAWLDGLLRLYGNRILPVDRAVAIRWGRLAVRAKNPGANLLIAATALEKGLTVVTRNEHHFEFAGVSVLNPAVLAPSRHRRDQQLIHRQP